MSHYRSSRKRPCCQQCGRSLWRHGERRWRCPNCRVTLRRHRRRRGPKRRRGLHPRTVERFLAGRHTMRSLRQRSARSHGATHERLRRGLQRLTSQLPAPALPERGSLIMVADALWLRVCGQRVTVYLVLLKRCCHPVATVIVALPLPGWESRDGWWAAVSLVPKQARRRVRGAVADDHPGIRLAVRQLCGTTVPLQWCQFHCLAEVLRRLGQKAVKRNRITGAAWQAARALCAEPRRLIRERRRRRLYYLAAHRDCAPRTRRAVRKFLTRYRDVTVVYRYPRRQIPATTGSAEAVCKQLRFLLTRIRPRSLPQLAAVCELLRRRSATVTCNGKVHRNY